MSDFKLNGVACQLTAIVATFSTFILLFTWLGLAAEAAAAAPANAPKAEAKKEDKKAETKEAEAAPSGPIKDTRPIKDAPRFAKKTDYSSAKDWYGHLEFRKIP